MPRPQVGATKPSTGAKRKAAVHPLEPPTKWRKLDGQLKTPAGRTRSNQRKRQPQRRTAAQRAKPTGPRSDPVLSKIAKDSGGLVGDVIRAAVEPAASEIAAAGREVADVGKIVRDVVTLESDGHSRRQTLGPGGPAVVSGLSPAELHGRAAPDVATATEQAVEKNPGPKGGGKPKGKSKPKAKKEVKQAEKKIEKQIVQAAASNVGRDLPSHASYHRSLISAKTHNRAQKRFRYRRGGVQILHIVGKTLLAAPTLASPSQGAVVLTLNINPHQLLAKVLNVEASLWELDEFTGLTFHCPAAAATTDASVLVMYVDLDPVDSTPSGQEAVDNAMNHGGTMFATRNGGILSVGRRKLTATGWKYVDAGDNSTADKRQTQAGVFRLLVETGASSTATLPVWATYSVAFKERALDVGVGPTMGQGLMLRNTTTASILTGNPLGWDANVLLNSAPMTNVGAPVTIGKDNSGSVLQLLQRDGWREGTVLAVSVYSAATDTKCSWTTSDHGMTPITSFLTSIGTSTAARANTFFFTIDAPVTAGYYTGSHTVLRVANGSIGPAHLATSSELISVANPGWDVRFSVDAVSTPTDVIAFISVLRNSSTQLALDCFGPATLEYAAAQEWDRKSSWQTHFERYRQEREDLVRALRAQIERMKNSRFDLDEKEWVPGDMVAVEHFADYKRQEPTSPVSNSGRSGLSLRTTGKPKAQSQK